MYVVTETFIIELRLFRASQCSCMICWDLTTDACVFIAPIRNEQLQQQTRIAAWTAACFSVDNAGRPLLHPVLKSQWVQTDSRDHRTPWWALGLAELQHSEHTGRIDPHELHLTWTNWREQASFCHRHTHILVYCQKPVSVCLFVVLNMAGQHIKMLLYLCKSPSCQCFDVLCMSSLYVCVCARVSGKCNALFS